MSLACGATVKRPRRMSARTRWACWPQQHTTPAAYDAHRAALACVAWPLMPEFSSIQTRASTRRTPSTKSSAAGARQPASGSIACHRSAGSSTLTSTTAVDSSRIILEFQAGAVSRIPPVDSESHRVPARSGSRGAVLAGLDVARHIAAASFVRPSRVTLEVRASLETLNRTGTRSASAVTWVTTPTMRWPWARVSSVVATTSRVSGSRVPKPSSRKMESSRAAPAAARAEICDGQGEGERQGGLEGLAAGQRANRTARVGVGVIDDVEVSVFVGEIELAAGQRGQVRRGVATRTSTASVTSQRGKLVGAQQVTQKPGHLLLALRVLPPG